MSVEFEDIEKGTLVHMKEYIGDTNYYATEMSIMQGKDVYVLEKHEDWDSNHAFKCKAITGEVSSRWFHIGCIDYIVSDNDYSHIVSKEDKYKHIVPGTVVFMRKKFKDVDTLIDSMCHYEGKVMTVSEIIGVNGCCMSEDGGEYFWDFDLIDTVIDIPMEIDTVEMLDDLLGF